MIEKAHSFQSRPAGETFQVKNEYVRPAQYSLNCGDGYGKSLLFYSYLIKDDMYEEKLIKEVSPRELSYTRKIWVDGMHTYNSSSNYEVIDIKTRRFNILNFIFRVWNKVKNKCKSCI